MIEIFAFVTMTILMVAAFISASVSLTWIAGHVIKRLM